MTSELVLGTKEVGAAEFRFTANNAWESLPEEWSFVEAVGVACDSDDRVYVFNRGEHPVIVFDPDGRFVAAWGEGQFVRPHGIWIAPDDTLWLSDDRDHTVRRYTPEGRLLATLGHSGQPSQTGVEGGNPRTIQRAAGPFNLPTNLATAPDGTLFVTDGYGNARVHRFSADGELLASWGEPGQGPGQFYLPHGIGIDSGGTVFVADRENSRLQLFSPDGEFLDEWTDVARPCEVFLAPDDTVYVAELGFRAGMYPDVQPPEPDATGGRVSIFDRSGNLLCRIGGGETPGTPGDFAAPHDIWVDRRGDVYLGEVVVAAAASRGIVGLDCPSLQKLSRLDSA